MNSEPKEIKRKIFIFKIIGLVIASIIAITTLLFIIFLPSRGKELLMSSDYAFVSDFIKDENNTRLSALTLGYLSENITEFETSTEVSSSLIKSITPENLSIVKAEAYSEDNPRYLIYSQGKIFFEIALSQDGKTTSGFTKWKIEALSIPENSEIGILTTLEAPHGASVYINGKELPQSFLIEENAKYHALTEFESGLSDTYKSDIYRLGIIFGQLDIEAKLGEQNASVSEYSKGKIKLAYPVSMTSAYSLTVPKGAEVSINGIPLGKEYITNSDFKYPLLTRFEEGLTNPPTADRYHVSGLFGNPEITVSYKGETLKKTGDGNTYALPDSEMHSYKILVPEGSSVMINGVSLRASEITAKNVDFPIMDGLTSYVKDRPYLVEYTVNGLFNIPKITAEDKNGFDLKADVHNSKSHLIYFSHASAPQVPENDLVTLRAFAKAYVKYMYSGTLGLSSNYNTVTGMTPGQSLAFTKLKGAYKTLYNTDIYKNIKFKEAEFSDYKVYTNNAFSCIVKLPFTASLDGQEVEKEITIEILYIFSGKIRRVINYLEY